MRGSYLTSCRELSPASPAESPPLPSLGPLAAAVLNVTQFPGPGVWLLVTRSLLCWLCSLLLPASPCPSLLGSHSCWSIQPPLPTPLPASGTPPAAPGGRAHDSVLESVLQRGDVTSTGPSSHLDCQFSVRNHVFVFFAGQHLAHRSGITLRNTSFVPGPSSAFSESS